MLENELDQSPVGPNHIVRTPLPKRRPRWVSTLRTSRALNVPAGTWTRRTPTMLVETVTP